MGSSNGSCSSSPSSSSSSPVFNISIYIFNIQNILYNFQCDTKYITSYTITFPYPLETNIFMHTLYTFHKHLWIKHKEANENGRLYTLHLPI
jgi:hypothetical protein